MGAFADDTPRLLWLCTFVACILLAANSYQVSADSKVDTDLIFDNLEQTNLKSHDNHPRIDRDVSSTEDEVDFSEPTEEHWLSSTVNRLKRSISGFFNTNEDNRKGSVHRRKNAEHRTKKTTEPGKSHVESKRKHRQAQQEARDEYDEDDDDDNGDDDEYANEYNNGSFSENGGIQTNTWSDDEDIGIHSGAGGFSGEVPEPVPIDTTTQPPVILGHPRVYRFVFTVLEPYAREFDDRNSNEFQNLARRVKQSIESLYEAIPGNQAATVISIQQNEGDSFKVRVTVDVDSDGFFNTEVIRNTVYDQIASNHRIQNLTVTPENFYFKEFEETQSRCDISELQCRIGQCVPREARCNGTRECSDNSDEEGCVGGNEPDALFPSYLPVTTDATPTSGEDLDEGSGDRGCRADDAVRCSDGSRSICADQQCDGVRDCDDGGDERNCPQEECAQGEFKCDVMRCIPLQKKCDGYIDCSDQTDEHNCAPECTNEEVQCDNKCIRREKVCDRVADCDDGRDEANCPESQCRAGEFSCGDGECIPDYLRCDNTPHCRNGNDEQNCSTGRCRADQFTCGTGKCIPSSDKCDRKLDCEDGSDERNCPCLPTDFHCSNGYCIPQSQRCDGFNHCQDRSDELGCTTCLPHEWRCNDGTCIDQIFRCNMLANCPDRSDEIGCNHCLPDQFRCSDGTCLNLAKRCDGISDCSHSEDEESCALCRQDQFRCSDGQCIDARLRCNNVTDCADRTDERDCNESPCASNEFRCDYGLCIDISFRCDGVPDCVDNSDEIRCDARERACREDELDCGDECVKLEFRCDGYQDCRDGRDEQGCENIACAPNEFTCASDRRCIPASQKCDGNSDCSDGSDEYECPTRCSANQLTCSDGSCYERYQQCDGNVDCADNTDERDCPCRPDQFQCLDGQCIDSSLRCNGRNDCSDSSDEYNCVTTPIPRPEAPVSCPNGFQPCSSQNQCIRREQFCDGRVDCRDYSDELRCPANDGLDIKTYPSSQDIKETTYQYDREVVFQCRDEGPLRANVHWARPNGEPLPPGSVDRNGRLEIPNIRIEHAGTYLCIATGYPPSTPGSQVSVHLRVDKWEPPPTLRPQTACGLYEATCSNGQCIPKDKVCDGAYDCSDGSDENRCNPNGCEPNEFRCDNRKCVLKTWRCDADDDCGDGSDEANCGTNPPGTLCQIHQFACHSNNQCIPRSYHCDNERDCVDGSDEIGCSKPVISKPPPPMITLNSGSTLIITCTAVGIPVPQIVWRLNWGHVPPKCRSTSNNGVGELICENIQVEDQGAYSCEAINIKGSVFAVPDTIVQVVTQSVCGPGYFNVDARTSNECIKCFCFGHTSNCRSADLFIYEFQPPFDALKLLGVRIDPYTGVVDIRDEPIYRGVAPQLTPIGPNGVLSTVPEYGELSQPNVVPYFAMPENYHGNQLKSYGGYLKYTVRHSNRGYPIQAPDVIITGNGYTLLHQSRHVPAPNTNEDIRVRFFEGEWVRKSEREPETTASREEIMMALEDIDNILIKLQYGDSSLNTSLSNIIMDSAAVPDSGLGAASYVEECSCPVGYGGDSCERCADGYTRQESGLWLGQCYKSTSCPPGEYFDGRQCERCPCPLTNPSNQFGRTCSLNSQRDVICDCPPGYVGNRCEYCAPGYVGNPLIPGGSCAAREPAPYCNPEGSDGFDSGGRCRCKNLVDGPSCYQCKANAFHLSSRNQFGCIGCFCMGISKECTSSTWYRDQVSSIFTSSANEFRLIDSYNRDLPISQGIRVNQQDREISYSTFSSPNAYYWVLPSRYLGNKITSYGGNLRYTIRHTPVPGGQSSRNSAADVELVSKNNINLLFYNYNQTQPSSAPQTFTVPILEQYWQRHDGQRADREHLLMALADLEGIYIKATYYTNTQESSLISVSLDIATDRNTGLERALEVEQCRCDVGYSGLSCENCESGYTRTPNGLYLGLCEPCSCNGHSSDCDSETGECLNCRDHTTGESCDQCLPDYEGDPSKGIPCRLVTPGTCSNCDPRGTVSNECRNGRCTCKANVEGDRCDRCRPGSFGLNFSNADGCESCFCSGVSTECSESNLFREQIPYIFHPNGTGLVLTDQYHRIRITDKFVVNIYLDEISYNFLPSQQDRLFWSLPTTFTGNQIKSYGGRLEFIQKYTQRPQARYVRDQDVIISGNGVTIYWSHPNELAEGIANPVSIPLHPSANWFRLDRERGPKPASREDILIVLANIDSILIRATQSSDTGTAYLSDITLDTAVEQNTGNPKASSVEACRCPQGYRGTSCESCASGYYRDLYFDQSKPLGSCSKCPCNDREESCELGGDRRVVCHCSAGYYGYDCGEITPPSPPIKNGTGPIPIPNITVTIEGPQLGIYEVGQSLRYKCSATSRYAPRTLTIEWRKDGGQLPPNAIDDGRGLLVITSLRVTDSGRYVCTADDGESIVNSSINVQVGGSLPPRVVVSRNLIRVDQNQPVQVRCAAEGIPTPDITLQRVDHRPLNPSHSFIDDTFRIPQAQISDTGDYECIATNSAGSDTVRFQIQVISDPSTNVMVVDIVPRNVTATSGTTVILRCVGTSAAAENAQSYTWSKQSGYLPYNSVSDRGVLTISNAAPDDSGIYICNVISSSGVRGSLSSTVNVIENSGTWPTVKVTPERITISQGQSTELRCTASGVPTPSVKWTKLGDELRSNVEQIGTVLYIRNAQPEDRGYYVCVGTNVHGIEQASAIVEVNRLEAPRLELYPGNQQTVIQGNSAMLQCRAVAGIPSPVIVWTRTDSIPLGPNVEEMSGGALRFIGITLNEEGDYVCTARNEAGTATAIAHIIVHVPPNIQITPAQDIITRNVGDSLQLQCSGSGNPLPNVAWSKYGDELTKPFSYNNEIFRGDLGAPGKGNVAYQEFRHLTKQDEGLYICRAESSAGVTEKRIQLIINTPPIWGQDNTTPRPSTPDLKDNERERFMAPEGTRAEIRCKINNENGPRIQVNWIRGDNTSLPREAYVTNGVLYIDNVQRSAAGEYRCLGIDTSTGRVVFSLRTYLDVLSPPRITLIPPRQIVRPGDHAYINCTATGEPPITISWSPIGRQMPASVYTRDGYIRFNSIKLEDAGRYRCRADNNAGQADAVAEVIVEETNSKPAITAEERLKIAPIGTTVALRCRAANPSATRSIRWIRENLPLPRNSRVDGEVLYIYNALSEDQGRYYCEVTTDRGTASDYIDLQLSRPIVNRPTTQPPQAPPILHITPSERDYYVGENTDIACQSSEPGAITLWSKLSGWMENNVQNIGGRLRINQLKPENAGVYRCETTGRQGPYYKDYNLNIIDQEVRDEAPIEVKTAPRGSSVLLECRTDLEEPVTYVWSKQGGNLAHYVDIYSKIIQLNEVGSNDAGTYTCSASSGTRSTDVPIILVVTGIVPYFTQAPNSYITLPTLGDSYIQFNFEISFKSETGNGLLLYNGDKMYDKGGDFISLTLVNGVPEFKFNLGHSTTVVRSDHPVTNREWHTVKVVRNRKKVTMYVDKEGPYIGTADGRYIGLDLTESLYLGGVPEPNNLHRDVFGQYPYEGFVGCISRFKIGHSHQDILRDNLNKTGITTCETCSDNKCQNNGACQEALSKEGYICICPSGFSGHTCSKLKGEACSPYACGVGRCIDTESGFECQCPLGRTGRRCEREITVNEPAFQNDAYIAYPTPRPARRLKISMRIKPNNYDDGVLLYCSETEEGHGDFISLAFRDRHLEFRFDAGNGTTVIRHNGELAPGKWHVLTASRTLSDGKLLVDGEPPAVGRLAGNHKTLNLQTPLYVGGYDKHQVKVNQGVKVESGFNGCISEISVSGLDINLIQNVTDSSNVENCVDAEVDNNLIGHQITQRTPYDNRQTGCSSNPCLNRGQCFPLTPIDYQCNCPEGYTGRNCERIQNICDQQPCQNQGVCKSNNTHYSCDCLLGFAGYNCEQRTELGSDAHFDGNGYLEFSRNLLPHTKDNESEIIALELSTNSSDGLIFWHGQQPNEDGQGQDFISLAIINGYLEYSFDLGMGPAIILNREVRVNDGERHNIILKRTGRKGSIDIDNVVYENGVAEGYTDTMDTSGNIYIGGTPNIARMTGSKFTQGFNGCIHGFEVQDSRRIDLGVKAINGLNVKPCSRVEDRNNFWRGDVAAN